MPTEPLAPDSIPWKTIAASPDMMDITFNNRRFPFAWRSSLAISVYEPPTEALPTLMCGQRIAFVKVTCSLTGYQPSGGDGGEVTFGDVPLEELERLTSEYLGCYGALLNVAFFPPSGGLVVVGSQPDLRQFPHVLDFSPKNRELIRGITESGEMLTGSSRSIGIDQSKTTTSKNETTVGVEAGIKIEPVEATASIEHTWGSSEENKQGLSLETGDSLQNKKGYATTLDQLYSLLTGYHTGTNRATVIMLARPGTLQATDRRTFALGLRMLEGVQDFVFVVARPQDQDRMCIEAALHTGHFPEDVDYVGEDTSVERRTFTFTVRARAKGGSEGFFSFQGQTIDFGTVERPQDVFNLPADEDGAWILDMDAPGSENGISRGEDRTRTDPSTPGPLANHYDLRVIRVDDRTVRAIGRVTARGGYDFSSGPDTVVEADFTIHARRPQATGLQPAADPGQMLLTQRGLSVCYQSVAGCPEVYDPPEPPSLEPEGSRWFDDLPAPVFTRGLSSERVYAHLRASLINGAVALQRGKPTRRYAETDHFSRQVASRLPAPVASAPVGQLVDLKDYGSDAQKQLANASVKQVLALHSKTLQRATRLKTDEALKLRRAVLLAVERVLGGEPPMNQTQPKPKRGPKNQP